MRTFLSAVWTRRGAEACQPACGKSKVMPGVAPLRPTTGDNWRHRREVR